MKTRIITGSLIALIVFPLLLIGKIPFLIGMILLIGFALHEVCKVRKIKPLVYIPYILITLFFTFFDYNNISSNFLNFQIYFPFIMIFGLYTLSIFKEDFTVSDANFLIVMSLFLTIFGRSAIYARNLNGNANFLFFIIMTTMAVDTCAYFIGVKYGKRKLNARVSPKKSIEGAIGGVVGGLAIALLIALFIPAFSVEGTTAFFGLGISNTFNLSNYLKTAIIALVLTFTGQIGDLMFSLIKRNYQIKDFSNLLPGHGGLIDRIDSISVNIIIASLLHILLFSI